MANINDFLPAQYQKTPASVQKPVSPVPAAKLELNPAAPAGTKTLLHHPAPKRNKSIVTAILLLFLLVGSIAAYTLMSRQQDTRQQAAYTLCTNPSPVECYGQQVCDGSNLIVSCKESSSSTSRCWKISQTCSNGCQNNACLPSQEEKSAKEICDAKNGFWCEGCGGFCLNDTEYFSKGIGCYQASWLKCQEPIPMSGVNYIPLPVDDCPSTHPYSCNCSSHDNRLNAYCFDRGLPDGSTCFTSNGLCQVVLNQLNQGEDVEDTGLPGVTNIYFCENKFNLPSGCDDQLLATIPFIKSGDSYIINQSAVNSAIPECYCGTIQVDSTRQGFKSYQSRCGCEVGEPSAPPTNPPTEPPTAPPTTTPEPLMCRKIEILDQYNQILLGDADQEFTPNETTLKFRCYASDAERVDHFEFALVDPDGLVFGLSEGSNTPAISEPYLITKRGDFTVECRVCESATSCQPYVDPRLPKDAVLTEVTE